MTCAEARERFTDLLDGVYPAADGADGATDRAGDAADRAEGAADRAEITAHLAECAECRHELESLQRTLALLGAVDPPRAPVGFVDRVVAAVRPPWYQRLARAVLWPLHVKLPLEAAAIVLVSVGVVYVFHRTPELQDAARPEVAIDTLRDRRQPPQPDSPTAAAGERGRAASQQPWTSAAPPPAAKDKRGASSAPGDEEHRPTASEMTREGGGDAVQRAEGRHRGAAAPSRVPGPREAASPAPPASDIGAFGHRASETAKELAREAPGAGGRPPGAATEQQSRPGAPTAPSPATAPPATSVPRDTPADVPRSPTPAGGDVGTGTPPSPASRADQGAATRARQESEEARSGFRGAMAAKSRRPDAEGRLAVADVAEAERRIRDVAARLNGVVTARAADEDAVVLELSLPGQYYSDLVRELASLGRFTPPRDPVPLPEHLRLAIRLER